MDFATPEEEARYKAGLSAVGDKIGSFVQQAAPVVAHPIDTATNFATGVVNDAVKDAVMSQAPGAAPSPTVAPGAGPLANPNETAPVKLGSLPQQQQATPPPTAIPMGTVKEKTTTTQSTSGVKSDPKLLEQQKQGILEADAAAMQRLNAAGEQGKRDAVYQQSYTDNLQKLNDEAELKRLDRQKQIDAEVQKKNNLVEEFKNAKVDPDKYWKDKGTGARIIGALAMGLGAMGAALTKGSNGAAALIESAINRDIAAQEKEIEVKKDRVNMQDNLIAQLRQRGLDDEQSVMAAKQILLEKVNGQIAVSASKYKSDDAKAQAEQIMGENQAKIAGIEQNAFQQAQRKVTTNSVTQEQTKPMVTPDQLAKMDEDKRKRWVPGAQALAATEDDAKLLKKFDATHNSLMGELKGLRQMVSEHGNESFGAVKAKMVQARNRIMAALKEKEQLGAMSDSDKAFLEEQIADPTRWSKSGANTIGLLDETIAAMGKGRVNTYQAYGMTQ